MKITKYDYGVTQTRETVFIYHLENTSGAYVDILNYGCRVVRILVPNRDGILTDVCLGFDSLADYEADTASFGAVVGRVANRIKDGRFSLNGTDYRLATNNGTNHLHGGRIGYASKVWDAEISGDRLILSMHSADGEEGYPGNLTLTVTYGWSEDNELSILYEAFSDRDTILNVTNHSYFNLSGQGNGDVLSHELFLAADEFTELDDTQAPTGKLLSVEGTPFDFRKMRPLGKPVNTEHEQYQRFGTYDHNFVIQGTGFREAAALQSRESGIRMTCFTDQPGLQLYVPPCAACTPGKDGVCYAPRTSVCLETQHFPDSVNHKNFPDIVLRQGDNFRSKTLYHFSTF